MMGVLVEFVVRRCRVPCLQWRQSMIWSSFLALEGTYCKGCHLWHRLYNRVFPGAQIRTRRGLLLTLKSRRVKSHPSLILYCMLGWYWRSELQQVAQSSGWLRILVPITLCWVPHNVPIQEHLSFLTVWSRTYKQILPVITQNSVVFSLLRIKK